MAKMKVRLESAQHILHHILTYDYKAKQTGMQIYENKIRLDMKCAEDLTKLSKKEFEERVNSVIRRNLPVTKTMYKREDVPKDVDISMVPASAREIRIIAIGDFDIQPCGNLHVDNTSEIGEYRIVEIKRIGKDTYRFAGVVLDKGQKIEEPTEKKEKFELLTAKGVRDFPPEEKIIREKVVNTLKEVFERYGYNPFENPVLERLDVLKAKFAAGEESETFDEIFTLKDRGERNLGLRFELTLGLCRFVGMNPDLKLPFKRYEIGRVYRDGPIKLGRYREFWQCDVDIVGSKSVLADAEILAIVQDVFKKLDFDIKIEVSNRKLLNGMLEECDVNSDLRIAAMISIDKLKRIGIDGVNKELEEKGINEESIRKLNKILEIEGSNENKLNKLKELIRNEQGKEGLAELEEMFSYLKSMNVGVVFNPTLARGLAYYTGPIYEVYLKDSKITSSVVGGGRYDEYIGNFLGGKKQIPATGLSFGLEPITEAIKLKEKQRVKSVAKVYVIPIGVVKESLELIQKLRKSGIKADMDVTGRGISKNLDYANSMGIPYVIFVGEKEIKSRKYKLKDMETGKETQLNLEEIVSQLS